MCSASPDFKRLFSLAHIDQLIYCVSQPYPNVLTSLMLVQGVELLQQIFTSALLSVTFGYLTTSFQAQAVYLHFRLVLPSKVCISSSQLTSLTRSPTSWWFRPANASLEFFRMYRALKLYKLAQVLAMAYDLVTLLKLNGLNNSRYLN
jgi:hypothetical protein